MVGATSYDDMPLLEGHVISGLAPVRIDVIAFNKKGEWINTRQREAW